MATFSTINSLQRFQNEKIGEIVEDIYKLVTEETFKNRGADSITNKLEQLMSKYLDELKKISPVIDPSSEIEADKFLKEIIPKLSNLKQKIAEDPNLTAGNKFHDTLFEFINEIRPIVRIFDYENFKNEKLKRQYKYFAERSSTMLDPYTFPDLSFLKGMYYSQYIYVYLDKVINEEPEEYKKYWASQRDVKDFDIFAHYGLNELLVSQLRKYETPSKLLETKYPLENFFNKMKSVMQDLRPFYLQLHAYVRHALQQKYGKEIVSENGPIPHHLLEQLELQSKNSKANFAYPFPDKGYPAVRDSFKEDLSTRKFTKKCDEFYQSIGFSPIPEKFWENHFKFEDCNECQTTDLIFSNKENSYLYVFSDIDFKAYLDMYTNLAKVHYDELTRNLSTSYMGEPYPGFTRSIGKAIKLSVLSPEYLKENVLNIDQFDEEMNLNRLYRMAIQSLFGMSQHYVYEKFWFNFIDLKTVTNNSDYWKIETDVRGVEPPSPRNETGFDVRINFLYSMEYVLDLFQQDRHSPIFEDILGFSIYKYICQKSGQYIPGDENHPLNKCNFYGNKDVGKFLISTLSSDPTNYWYEIFDNVFGDEVGLDASAYLEYFEPLKVWLEQENKKNNVFIGWKESSNKCE